MVKFNKKIAFSLATLILPWLTVPFMGKRNILRFLPVASFINLFLSVFSLICNKKKWWKTNNPISPGPIDFTYILGPYFVATLWIFKLTYGNFRKYLIMNMVLDLVNAYPMPYIGNKFGIVQFKKMTHTGWYIINVSLAVIIYGFQALVEKAIRKSS
ncbi:hypothetical protein J14TS2_07410 [Bacillus sp. J14TS2]|uniref:hypothetical protein n=1 Tax=unclassified Bacillus (in: firmicutes) TaxID=185979 RepID=UPI001A9582B3|nr:MULTISPECIES: hypothetical protein [unclassified Bacillus (in: firmicutes)]MBO0992955.1 hypothetical protein [Bacillus sp. SD088]GIN70266.1 hypothetical protein J14TS2_07410 [Bacillus sp. J14TS2]